MRAGVKINIVGGGPAGLYAAILLKGSWPSREITVSERNRPDDTFGFGVVFSDATMAELEGAEPEVYREIAGAFAHWDDIDVHYGGLVLVGPRVWRTRVRRRLAHEAPLGAALGRARARREG